MIRSLSGSLQLKDLKAVCIDVQGVGYQVHMPLGDLASIGEVGEGVQVHVHTHVREGAIELFGFSDARTLALFERLITISGVGPKSAIGILSGLDPDEFLEAVASGDEKRLCRAPGVGKKTAGRIILELKDKLQKDGLVTAELGAPAAPDVKGDLASALSNLGYRPAQVEKALTQIAPLIDDGTGLEDLVREALRRI